MSFDTLGASGPTVTIAGQSLTPGTAVPGAQAITGATISKFSWTNAQIVALGAVLSGNIALCTLPAKTLVRRAIIIITGQAAGTTTLTVSMGRTAAAFTDYVTAQNAKAAANTAYFAAAVNGANLTTYDGDLPSVTATTLVNLQFVSTVSNLSAVTGSSGDCYIETVVLP